jgi:ABC-2 type transport system ATP-binding protein
MSGDDALAVRTEGVGKRYGSTWALRDCSVTVPQGRVCALVGPNGAGKTTLLRLLAGLGAPTAGAVWVFDRPPSQDRRFLAQIGYLGQEAPLYRRLSAAEHLALGRHLNPVWDDQRARERLADLHIPLDRPVGTLSGGQRSQVALGLALAKRPRLLLLDEPVAALDPLARREFLASLAVAAADGDLTVLLSSHLVHDIEHVCDHLVLLADGTTQVNAAIDTVLAEHRLLVGPRRPAVAVPGATVVDAVDHGRQTRLVARLDRPVLDPAWQVEDLSLEEIILAYMTRRDPLSGRPLSLADRNAS